MSVGQDLLDVPFPKMILSMAQAIAKSQLALDLASINTVKILASTTFAYLPEITEVLEPKLLTVSTSKGDVIVTGTDVVLPDTRTFPLTLLQAGVVPTFYQFTESIIEVKMSITSKVETQSEFEFGAETKVEGGFLFASGSFSSHVNYKTSSKYSYDVTGSSLLRTTLKPAPPPARMMPRLITVNAVVSPPKITISE